MPPKHAVFARSCLRILILVGYLLSFTLVSCGQSQITGSSTPGTLGAKKTIATATPHIDLLNLLKLNPQMSQDITGKVFAQLQGIQIVDGYDSGEIEAYTTVAGGINCGSAVVLSSSDLTYNSAQVQEMRTYLDASFTNVVVNSDTDGPPNPPGNPNAIPSELRWVQGVPGATCIGDMELTNESSSPLQIMGVGADLLQNPVANSFQYHLIDKCSVLGGCISSAVGGGPDCVFYVDIKLAAGKVGSSYQDTVKTNGAEGTAPCATPIILDSHHVVDILVRFTPASRARTGMIYQIDPYLLLGNGSSTVKTLLPKLASTVVFSSNNQYGCYVLRGKTFVLDKSIDLTETFSSNSGALCV